MNKLQNLFKDNMEHNVEKSLVYLSLRIIVGLIFVYHGYNKFANKQKLTNWTKFICSQNLPSWMALLSAVLEVMIGLFLISGLFIKVTSIVGILFMTIALYLAHRNDKIIPIYQISIIVMLTILFFTGPGKYRILPKN